MNLQQLRAVRETSHQHFNLTLVAQALGVELSFGVQATILLVAMATSKGASGVAGDNLRSMTGFGSATRWSSCRGRSASAS